MKLFIDLLNTTKAKYCISKYRRYTFILNKKNINKIKLKEYFFKNYSIKLKKINILKINHKNITKVIIQLNSINDGNLFLDYEKNNKTKV